MERPADCHGNPAEYERVFAPASNDPRVSGVFFPIECFEFDENVAHVRSVRDAMPSLQRSQQQMQQQLQAFKDQGSGW